MQRLFSITTAYPNTTNKIGKHLLHHHNYKIVSCYNNTTHLSLQFTSKKAIFAYIKLSARILTSIHLTKKLLKYKNMSSLKQCTTVLTSTNTSLLKLYKNLTSSQLKYSRTPLTQNIPLT